LKVLAAAGLLAAANGAGAAGLGSVLGQAGSWSLGIGVDHVDGQDLELDQGSYSQTILGIEQSGGFPPLDHQLKSPSLDGTRVGIEGIVGLHSHVDLFARVSAGSNTLESTLVEPGISSEDHEFDSDTDVAWSVGLRAKLFENDHFKVMARAEYLQQDSDADFSIDGTDFDDYIRAQLAAEGASDIVVGTNKGSLEVEEWRAALVVGRDMGMVTPYAGVEYRNTDVTAKARVAGTESGGLFPFGYSLKEEYQAEDEVGLLVGFDAKVNSNVVINGEIGMIYGTSFRLNAQWLF